MPITREQSIVLRNQAQVLTKVAIALEMPEIADYLNRNILKAVPAGMKPVSVATPIGTAWEQIPSFKTRSGSKTWTIATGMLVAVKGFGRRTAVNPEGAAQEGWRVTMIEQRATNHQDINVTVSRHGVSRCVKASKIEYRRPKRAA